MKSQWSPLSKFSGYKSWSSRYQIGQRYPPLISLSLSHALWSLRREATPLKLVKLPPQSSRKNLQGSPCPEFSGQSIGAPLHRRSHNHVAGSSVATMPDTLHLSTSSSTTPPFITPKFLSLSRPKHVHFAPPPPTQPDSNSISTSMPSTAPLSSNSQENNNITPPPNSQLLQEKLLYLDSLGLDSLYCLAAHPPILSSPLSQIKSLVKFLHSLGLTTPDLRRAFSMCPDILAAPLKTVSRPAVTFLLREAHVNCKDLRHIINRRPRLLTCSVDRRLRPTLYFLRDTIGIDDVSRCAPLLSCCVESKFIPRLDYFLKLGIPKREAISLFRRFPSLFCYSIEGNLEPKFKYFVVEMGRELRELVDFPHYFSFSLENRIKPRHKMSVERGVCLSLPVMLKSSEARFMDRLEVCCDSSVPLATSSLWCKRVNLDINVT